MRNKLTSLAELAGAALIVTGLGLAWLPLAFVAAGAGLIAAAYLADGQDGDE